MHKERLNGKGNHCRKNMRGKLVAHQSLEIRMSSLLSVSLWVHRLLAQHLARCGIKRSLWLNLALKEYSLVSGTKLMIWVWVCLMYIVYCPNEYNLGEEFHGIYGIKSRHWGIGVTQCGLEGEYETESDGVSKDLTVGVRVVSVGARRRMAKKKRGLDGGLVGYTV